MERHRQHENTPIYPVENSRNLAAANEPADAGAAQTMGARHRPPSQEPAARQLTVCRWYMSRDTTNEWATAHRLSRESGSADRHVQRWCAGVPTRRAGARILYQRDPALAAIRIHQRARKSGPEVGLQALAATMTHDRRVAEIRTSMLAFITDQIAALAKEIEANSPPGDPPVTDTVAQFSAVQRAWLLRKLEKPFNVFWGIIPDEIRVEVNPAISKK
jgi:hypothetical protein